MTRTSDRLRPLLQNVTEANRQTAALLAEVTKAARPHGRPGPGGQREPEIVDHYRAKLEEATRLGIRPTDLVRQYLSTHHPDLAKGWQKDAIGTPADQAAIQAWLTELITDTDQLRAILRDMHADAYLSGVQTALDQLAHLGAATVTSDLTDAATSIDWSKWKPGDPAIADMLTSSSSSGGLAQLLARTDITIQGLQNTTINRIGDLLAQGVAAGDNTATIANSIDAYLGDPSRAEMIAVTETNRAMTLGTVDQYRANGVAGFDVVNANPCPLCDNIEQDNPHPLGDDTPPYHPRCRCSISPVLIMPDGSEVEDTGTTDFGE